MAKNTKKNGMTLKQKMTIIWIAGGCTVVLLGFTFWFGIIRTGILKF